MFRVALLPIALLALVDARIYERCELARDLLGFGIKKEHLATWVCIAFHESRFDTAARNPYSGDHGLLQISELYWCGAGKACGLPCSALRDDDISDDVECALRVHEEHTRLQGNGFLAWVVYPQHCKHNAKKYLADCDSSVKTSSVRTDGRARVLKSQNRNITTVSYNSKIDELLPPYLAIGSLFRGNYEKEFEQNYKNKVKVNWLNYKIDNIDDLKLPVFNQKVKGEYTTTTIATTTTTTSSPPPKIKPPNPRRIESNSFRRKKTRPIFETVKFVGTTDSSKIPSPITTPRSIYKPTIENTGKQDNLLQSTTRTNLPLTTTTTSKPSLNKLDFFSSSTAFTSAAIQQQTTKSTTPTTTATTTTTAETTIPQEASKGTTDRSSTTISSIQHFFTTDSINQSLLPNKTSFSGSKSHNYSSVAPIWTSTSTVPTKTTRSPFSFGRHETQPQSTTSKPWFNSWLTWKTTSNYKTTVTSTTSKPSSIMWRTSKAPSRVTIQINDDISRTESKNQATTSRPGLKSRGLINFKTLSTKTLLLNSNNNLNTSKVETTTSKTYSITPALTSLSTARSKMETKSTTRYIEVPSSTTVRTTQSIFDLYLKPTKRPYIPTFSLPPFKNRALSLRIFAGGTTTLAPIVLSDSHKSVSEDVNNQVRRQA